MPDLRSLDSNREFGCEELVLLSFETYQTTLYLGFFQLAKDVYDYGLGALPRSKNGRPDYLAIFKQNLTQELPAVHGLG